jgi:DNA-binding NarL/FixJ family response regulator
LGAAVHALSRDPYDVVVTDLILSERDGASGLDLIERVRRDYPTLAVVVLAGEPSLSERQLLKANVPVVAKGPTSFDVLPGVIVDAVRTAREAKRNRAGAEIQGSGGASGSLDHARHVYSKEAERLQQRKESTVILRDGHIDLPKAFRGTRRTSSGD